ncbi:MAG: efflux RND transporter permease subunit, partial [Deltaproteobacteria bacterium]|nr:efflux RND transporter permease subunit [Deltaproteobacteria bacterium]
MKLPEFSVKQPVASLMLFLALAMMGIFAITRLNIDMLPDISPPVISILTSWYGASASDVETEVTEPIEDVVSTVNNLDTLTSKSMDNLSLVSCKFDWGTDLNVASNDIRDQLDLAKRYLPDDVEKPILFKFSSATAPILFMTISGPKSWPRLFHIVDKQVVDELKRVPGVGAIIVHGGLRRRINIYFDLAKLEGYGISLARVNQVLAAQNLNIPAGRIKSGTRDYFVRVPGRYKSAREVAETVIGYFNNAPIYLKDVAEVEDGYEPQDVNGWGDGLPALVLILQKQTGKNTVNVVRRVKEKLKELQEVLPSDVKINIIMDSSEDILTSVKNLRTTLFYGIFFVILVTLAFLRRLRTAFIISLTIPFSLIIAFILLYLFGYTINLVSLMSLAIASGMVVDNGIVVLENIMRHIERGGRIKTAAMLGASEMGLAISASTLTTVVVFVPLMFLTGLAGIIFKQLGITLVVTLTASLLVALMLIPTLASRLVKATPKALKQRTGTIGKLYGLSEEGFEFLERLYAGILGWALGHRRTVVALAVVIFLSSISLIPFLSTSFFPKVDSGDISIRFRLPEGSRIEETNKVMEAILKNIDEVVKPEEMRHSYAFDGETKEGIGVALGFDQGPNVGSIGFKLVDRDKRTRSADEIAAALRKRVRSIPGLNKIYVRAESGITSILMGTGKPVSLEIQGPDLEQLVRLANQVKQKMLEIPGLVDVEITQKDPRPELWVEVDRKKASALGLSVANIAVTLRNYFYGLEATKFREAGDNYDIFTRLTERDKNNLFNLPEAPIYTPDGRMIKLKNIAKIIQDEGPIEIERKNRQKIVKVEADTFGRSLGAVTADLKKALSS